MRLSRASHVDSFGTFVQRRRRARMMSQVEIALEADISPAYWGRMEAGTVPTPKFLARLIKNLGEDLQEWLRAAGRAPGGESSPGGEAVAEEPHQDYHPGEAVPLRAEPVLNGEGEVVAFKVYLPKALVGRIECEQQD